MKTYPKSNENWRRLATTLGYSSEKAMLTDLYITQGLSQSQIAQKLGFSKYAINRRLRLNNIPARSRGGPHKKYA